MMTAENNWSLYLIRTRDGAIYTGIATDVDRRLEEHRKGGSRGSKYLRHRGPLELVYRVQVGDRSLAQRLEAQLKQCSKTDKEKIVTSRPDRERLLEILAVEISGE
jgi:putative endonuclease